MEKLNISLEQSRNKQSDLEIINLTDLKLTTHEFEQIIASEHVQCPNNNCPEYGNHLFCGTHLYVKCDEFVKFYDRLTYEQVKTMYG